MRSSVKTLKPIIGLEIHVQILSKSKLFSHGSYTSDTPSNQSFALLDAGIPGSLPIVNRRCVEAGILAGKALKCSLNQVSLFDRKHYFYPDLPTGYQITQSRIPLAVKGLLDYVIYHDSLGGKFVKKCARIAQVQLEQDSGKTLSMCEEQNSKRLIDLSRCGTGLLEVVSHPEFTSAVEAISFVRELRETMKAIGVSSGRMEEGTLRVDANVSLVPEGAHPLSGTRTEVKNMNSLRHIERAINFEISRQSEIILAGDKVLNETRYFDIDKGMTVAMRDKETIQDYRYLPEPNLPPLILSDELLALEPPFEKLPFERRKILIGNYGLSLSEAWTLLNQEGYFDLMVDVMKTDSQKKLAPRQVYHFIMIELTAFIASNNLPSLKSLAISPTQIYHLLLALHVHHELPRAHLQKLLLTLSSLSSETKCCVSELIHLKDISQINDKGQVEELVRGIIFARENKALVQQWTHGKKRASKLALNSLFQQLLDVTDHRVNTRIAKEIFLKFKKNI